MLPGLLLDSEPQHGDTHTPMSLSLPRRRQTQEPPLFHESSRENLKNTSIWDLFCLPLPLPSLSFHDMLI